MKNKVKTSQALYSANTLYKTYDIIRLLSSNEGVTFSFEDHLPCPPFSLFVDSIGQQFIIHSLISVV